MSTPAPTAGTLDPIVVDLGKVKKKDVKALEEGHGVLLDEVASVVAQVRDGLGSEGDGKTILPVVVLYRRRPKRRKLSSLLRL